MTEPTQLYAGLSRLAQKFDISLRTNTETGAQGWGQFISAESHSQQVGLYGTCSGILVKSLANSEAHYQGGVVTYLQGLWENRNKDTDARRYFSQTARLAFFVLSLAHARHAALKALRLEAEKELLSRQLLTGAWGDWKTDGTHFDEAPGVQTTALATLALLHASSFERSEAIERAGTYLQSWVVGKIADPLILGVTVNALPPSKISSRLASSALACLTGAQLSNDLVIFFFDYCTSTDDVYESKRDFLCIPRFFAFSLLAGSPHLAAKVSGVDSIRMAAAHQRAIVHLGAVLQADLLKADQALYPATVDQAFVALSVHHATKRSVRFGRLLKIARPAYRFVRTNFVCRVVIPFIVIGSLGTVAEDPGNAIELLTWLGLFEMPAADVLTKRHEAQFQWVAIVLVALAGQPCLSSISRYFRDKWRSE